MDGDDDDDPATATLPVCALQVELSADFSEIRNIYSCYIKYL